MREYWIQVYVKNRYRDLGFSSLHGPFDTGYDFKGVYQGREVVVEVETSWENFVKHGHDPNEVDVLMFQQRMTRHQTYARVYPRPSSGSILPG